MKQIAAIAVFAFILSCGKTVTYIKRVETGSNNLARTSRFVTIDTSYHSYIRTLYRVDSSDERTTRANISEQPISKKLIELEYLLLSEQEKKAIYISTITDYRQQRYEDRHDSTLRRINVFDFKVLLFGTLDELNKISFVSRNRHISNVWQLQKTAAGVDVNAIVEQLDGDFNLYIPADQALKEKLSFVKLDTACFTYRQYDEDDPSIEPKFIGRIEFDTHCKKDSCNKYRMYFKFDKELVRNRSYTEVFLRDSRLGSIPDATFDFP